MSISFGEAWDHVRERSAMTEFRAERLWWHAQAVRDVPGDVAEIGVYRGASLYLLACAFEGTGKRIHGFDTFMGFPALGAGESGYIGEMASRMEDVGELVAAYPVHLWRGPIEEATLPPDRWALVHIDCDLESCYRTTLARFWPGIAAGGVLVMDDYGFGRWPGAARSANEFFDGTAYRIEGIRGDDWHAEVLNTHADWSFVQGVVRKCR